jgi:hypothetical protein
LRPQPQEPQLPGLKPNNEPPQPSPSGCSCRHIPVTEGVFLLFAAFLLRRRRAS